jgi:hypothetical protein
LQNKTRSDLPKALRIRWQRFRNNLEVWQLSRRLLNYTSSVRKSSTQKESHPVIFFNASTRLVGISQNAAFSMLAAMGLQAAGIPVVYFGCNAGMLQCVLGTRLDDLSVRPPCRACVAQSRWLFSHAPVVDFKYQEDPGLAEALARLDLESLTRFTYRDIPLGELVLPSIRWALRRHHLAEDPPTHQLYRNYILSAYHVAKEFTALLERIQPECVVVFNGMFFPEAAVRYVTQKRGIPVVTHEVGLRPFTGFFTYGQATAYPLDIPDSFQMNAKQQQQLDAYLEKRFQGQFSMAGIKFWKAMGTLEATINQKIEAYRQLVTVFTNVVFDTSQPHSNVVFPHMFAWLEQVEEIARQHQDTLFIIRAHPDENRLWKESRESVSDWVYRRQIESQPNLIYIEPSQATSSYELIQRSKFIMIYNSTIGLEASILGKPVLCAGRARFTQLPTVFFPQSVQQYRAFAEEFLTSLKIEVPPEYQSNARRFLYYQLFRSSLPFDSFVEEDGIWPGFVRLRNLNWQDLHPTNSLTHSVIYDGILKRSDFMLPEEAGEVKESPVV